MRKKHWSVALIFLVVFAMGAAWGSNIDQSPRRFASFNSRYVLTAPVSGAGGTLGFTSSPDNWLGGAGNWSNGADWSAGLPGVGNDVFINTGSDNVTLDTSFSINSLTLGGSTGSSQLTGDGNAHTLTIAGALTVNQSGNLYLSNDNMTAGVGSANSGTLALELASSLQINGDFNNSGSLNVGQALNSFGNNLDISGTLTNIGTLNLGHADINSAGNGNAIIGALNNSGMINLGGNPPGSTLQVNGNATNSGRIYLDINSALSVNGDFNNSGNLVIIPDDNGLAGTITIGGTLTNTSTGYFLVGGVFGSAQVGTLINQGTVAVVSNFQGNAYLTVGDFTNSGLVGFGPYGINHLSVGTLTNSTGGDFELQDQNGTLSAGTLNNAGTMNLAGHVGNNFSLQVTGSAINSGAITSQQYSQIQTGAFTNSGSIQLNLGSELQVSGDVNNSGTIATSQSGEGLHGNTVIIAGKLTNVSGATFSLGSSSDLANIAYISNAGTVSLAAGTDLNVTGGPHSAINSLPGFLNSGIVDISSGATLASPLTFTQTGGQTTVDGTLSVSSRGAINLAGGTVYGDNGTLRGSVVSNAAINIGDSPLTVGHLSFMGNYSQLTNGSLTFDIAGNASGQYDQLNVSGHAQLNGLMTLDLLHGYVPQIGNTFDIMNFASASGTFSMVVGLPINGQEHFVLEYNSTNLTLDVAAGQVLGPSAGHGSSFASDSFITTGQEAGDYALTASNSGTPSPAPEPGSILLFGSGVIGLAGLLRRRR